MFSVEYPVNLVPKDNPLVGELLAHFQGFSINKTLDGLNVQSIVLGSHRLPHHWHERSPQGGRVPRKIYDLDLTM